MDRPLLIRTSPMMPTPLLDRQMMEEFWRKKEEEIEAIEDFGERAIPVTRLRKLIGAEKGNMMMTFDTPSFVTKACEIFVQELSFRASMCASSHHRSIILDADVAEAIATTESYDFLKDTLHAFREEQKQNSVACSKPTKKHYRSTNQASTSHHSLNQGTQFHPQFAQYPPVVRVPHPLPPTISDPMTLPFPFPLQQAAIPLMSTIVRSTPTVAPTMTPPINYMATGMGFSRNGINTTVPSKFFFVNNSIVASGVMTRPLQVHAETTTNIPSTSLYMNMINAFAPAYDVGGATDNNIDAAQGQRVAMEEDHILPEEVAEMASSMMHADDTTNADDNTGAHQQQIDIDDGHQEQQNQVDGSLDVVVASADAANNAGGDDYDASWDEFVIPDDSFMSTFWEEIMMEDNPATTLLPDATTSADLLTSDMQDLEGSRDESDLFDEDLSPSQAQAAASSPKAQAQP
jgi:nuclear transcription factor Y, gamma